MKTSEKKHTSPVPLSRCVPVGSAFAGEMVVALDHSRLGVASAGAPPLNAGHRGIVASWQEVEIFRGFIDRKANHHGRDRPLVIQEEMTCATKLDLDGAAKPWLDESPDQTWELNYTTCTCTWPMQRSLMHLSSSSKSPMPNTDFASRGGLRPGFWGCCGECGELGAPRSRPRNIEFLPTAAPGTESLDSLAWGFCQGASELV